MRERKPELNTRTPKGKSQRPKIQPTTNPYRCKSRNSMAKASRCDWPKTDRKSAPRKSVRAAISFSVFTNIMGTKTKPRITISEACVLFRSEEHTSELKSRDHVV